MSDLHTRILAAIEHGEQTARAATPGPWEPGHVWLRAGVLAEGTRYVPAGQCAYCHLGEPVLIEPNGYINGTRMVAHTHRAPDPYDPEHSISGAAPYTVLTGSGDYGEHISPADAAHIALHDPAAELRRYAAARRVLDRHHLTDYRLDDDVQPYCACCGHEPTDAEPYCPDVLDLADSVGVQP